MLRNKCLMVGSVVVLVFVIGIQLYVNFFTIEEYMEIEHPLSAYLPGSNWRAVKFGNSEREESAVVGLLNFDEAIQFEKDGVHVYMAYWRPGKMPYDLVGFHSPDVCWVEAGWEKGSEGVFTKGGEERFVRFWHIVGGRCSNYEHYGYSKGLRARGLRYFNKFLDIFRYGLASKKDQLVVRVDSKRSLESSVVFDELMNSLRKIKGLN